ncbi:MAG: hypothetical protein ACYC6A_08995 [Armatimonadota bacterium]
MMNAFVRQFIILLLACLFAGMARAEPPAFPPVDVSRLDRNGLRTVVHELLRTYSPTGKYVLDRCAQCPNTLDCGGVTVTINPCPDPVTLVKSRTLDGIISDLTIVVHEMTHEYQHRIAFAMLAEQKIPPKADRYHAYYTGTETILVQQTRVYRTSEMQGLFPAVLRTERFPVYVFPARETGAQLDGIYGLLDEYDAYYIGTKTALDFYNYYRISRDGTPEDWFRFFDNMNRYYFAQAEFRLYILNYLRYAKAHHPEVYTGVMGNAAFRRAFREVDSGYAKLVQDYFAAKAQIFAQLRADGYEVDEDDEFTRIGRDGAFTGRSNFLKSYHALTAELAKPEYQALLKEL